MKILIVEDSRLLASSIKTQLSKQFTVDIVHTGKDCIYQTQSTEYGVILLDLGLPDMDGIDVVSELRRQSISTPILVLSGTRDTDTRVRLLKSGADDYVTKPFDSEELKARISALLRRHTRAIHSQEVKVEDLTIDIARRRVTRAGKQIVLRRKEFDILQYLVENRGQTVTRDMIFSHVWESGKEGSNNTIDVHIKHLRDKIDRPFEKALIRTTYGVGYMIDEA
jgi:DNA-binding response OmpR family regulator